MVTISLRDDSLIVLKTVYLFGEGLVWRRGTGEKMSLYLTILLIQEKSWIAIFTSPFLIRIENTSIGKKSEVGFFSFWEDA
jgi:hypothetical protein